MSLKSKLFFLIKDFFGKKGLDFFWFLYWKIEEKKEERELGVPSLIPIRGSERATLIETLLSAQERSFLEVGFGYGQNLKILSEFIDRKRLYALELSLDRISATRSAQGVFPFINGDVCSLPFGDKSVDLVFSSALLLYLPPDKIKNALAEMFRVARKRVVLLEQSTNGIEQELEGGVVGGTYWVRDYERLILDNFFVRKVSGHKIKNPRWPVESWEALGMVVEVLL